MSDEKRYGRLGVTGAFSHDHYSTLARGLRLNWQFTAGGLHGQAFGILLQYGRSIRPYAEIYNAQMHFPFASHRGNEPSDTMERRCGF